jgi:hypothetical protein
MEGRTMATSSNKKKDGDDEGKTALPITGEVGSEGGSYSDGAVQVSTRTGDVGKTAEANEPEKVTTGKEDVLRYPDEKAD